MIEYSVGHSDQKLVLTAPVIQHFVHHRQLEPRSHEAGGQLFARIAGSTVQVDRATGPRASDRRRLRAFIPNRSAERRETQRLFKEGLHYVGDWHTHAELHPKPSSIDIASVQDMFHRSRHRLASFVMVVVGTAAFPEGLFVGIVNDVSCRQLFQPLL